MRQARHERRTWPFGHVLAALAFGTGLGACFNPPADAVLFACDPAAAPTCPSSYTCEVDGCCHRDGSDVAANLGSCRLGGPGSASEATASTGPSTTSASTTSTTTSTSTGDTGPTTGMTADTSTTSTTGTTADTGATADTGTTAGTGTTADAGSSSASTGG